jgi:hypothetical protein
MKKTFLLSLIICFTASYTFAQEDEPVSKGSYSILKFDALNLMGIGIQKLHLGYEVSPMKANPGNLPTVQFNLTVPFNSLNYMDMNYGVEGGAELRFYQPRRNKKELLAEGFYMGVGLDGGYSNFNKLDYYQSNFGANKEVDQEYERIRTGIYFLSGAQTKLGDKLYFDINVGLGWSNVNVKEVNPPADDPSFYKWNEGFYNVFYILYEEGKYQRFYMPVSFGIGYNFGSK